MLTSFNPSGRDQAKIQVVGHALEVLVACWRALRTHAHSVLIRVFGRNHAAAEPFDGALAAAAEWSPSPHAGRTAGRELVTRLAVTQGSRMVLVFEDARCESADGTSSRWQTEPHFVNLCRNHVLERRLGMSAGRASARRGQSRI